MKKIENTIDEAAQLMAEIGFDQRQKNLNAEKQRTSREKYKVAVIGQFKAGKSTLINKTLLKEDVLFTDPLEATAVPTEIEYGPAPGTLEIYPWLFEVAKDEPGGTSPVPSGEGAPRRIENPTTEDLKRETSDPTPEGRAVKATKTARVRLLWPAEGLQGFTVVDTPGIDATNPAVVTTTYRVIPEADATIYVKTPRALDQIDVNFLRSHVFDAGVSRMMVAISYDPAFGRKSPENIAAISGAINAKLAEIGRPSIPVRVMELGDTAKFEAILQNFIRENVQPGRLERCQAVVRKQLQQALAECDVELAALKKSPSEVARLEAEVAKKAEEFEDNYRRLMEGFLLDLCSIQAEHYLSISERLDKVAETFIAGFEKCTSLKEAQQRLADADSLLKLELETVVLQVSNAIQIRVRELQDKYRAKVGQALHPLATTVASDLRIDGGPLARVPYWAVLAGDILIVLMLGPFHILDLILRYIVGRIPVLQEIVPTHIVLNMFVSRVKESVREEFPKMKRQIKQQLAAHYENLEGQLRKNWETNGQELLAPMLDPLRRELTGRDPERQAVLTAGREKIEKMLALVH